ncbi:response regulator [Methylomonas sp. CM2]|uniref:response regulator transcription factor n=1 Tax=Methylomonas sp. CM2 TaxID=3417647 RepID=UPI003CFA9BB5
MKILLLDDHALFRAGLRLLLQALDRSVTVFEAGTIAEALAVAAEHADLRLCLLDLSLRGEDGLAAVADIKAVASDVAVVVVTASDEPATVRACINAGAMSFIPKSSAPDVLAEALKYVMAGAVYLPAAMAVSDGDWAPINLSPRQRDVLRGLCRGLPTKSIARDLGLSEHTVKDYIAALFKALDVHNRTEAVIKTGRLRLLPSES